MHSMLRSSRGRGLQSAHAHAAQGRGCSPLSASIWVMSEWSICFAGRINFNLARL